MNYTKTNPEMMDAIEKRHSPRAFADEMVPVESLETILQAGQWAASSFNEQPWRFLIGRKGEGQTWKKIHDALNEGNQSWAGGAPVLIAAVSKKEFTNFTRPNRHHLYDTGQAVSAMALQAAILDIYFHQMAGYSQEKLAAAFGIPDEFESAAIIAVGYKGDPDQLPEPLREKETAPRSRKPLSEIVFTESWENSWQ